MSFLKPRRRLFAVYRWMYHAALKGTGFDNWKSMQESGEGWAIHELLPSLIRERRPVMLDVGAHHGEYSLELQKAFPEARIHAFEPHPITFHSLKSAVPASITLHQCAIGAKPGSAELYDRKTEDGSVHASLSEEALRTLYRDEPIVHQVEVQTLDDFLAAECLDRVDFIKIDTEGYEMDVLNGGEAALVEGRVGIIQFEFNSLHAARRQFLCDFMDKLPNHRLYRLLSDGMIALDLLRVSEREVFAFQNILAIPSETAPRDT